MNELLMQRVKSLIEAELSQDDKRSAIYKALEKSEKQPDGSYRYRYIEDIFDTFVVYQESHGGGERALMKRTYVIDAQGACALGVASEVRLEKNYVPVTTGATSATEAATSDAIEPTGTIALHESLCELREARAIDENGFMDIKLISPGWGSSGYYSKEILERDMAEAFPKGTLMFADHATAAEEAERPEGRVLNTVAAFESDPFYLENGPEGPGAYTKTKVFDDYHQAIEARAPYVGVSINGDGTYEIGEAEGRTGPIITSITRGKSVDIVTRAGRGGKIVTLQESLRASDFTEAKTDKQTKEAASTSQDNSQNSMNDQEIKTLQERASRLEESVIANDAERVVRETLKDQDIPAITRERLIESLSKAPVVKTAADGARSLDGDAFKTSITKAVESELAYLNSLQDAGAVRGMGAADTSTRESDKDKDKAKDSSGLRDARASIGL